MTGKKSLMRFKRCILKLGRCIQLLHPVRPIMNDYDLLDTSHTRVDLVPKGHFAVLAGNDEEEKTRFVIELRYLRNSGLVELLKDAGEEYGFQQEGALVVPCTPEHLHTGSQCIASKKHLEVK